jgi:putative addiction module component (TIGR02574 family)
MNIQQLTASEKIILVEQLWDSVRSDSFAEPLSTEQKQLLDARLEAVELDGQLGDSWGSVLQRVTQHVA